MLKKTLIAAAALTFLALGATSSASAHDRGDRSGRRQSLEEL